MGSRTIVFVHGMYMTSQCWAHWVTRFEGRGYRCIAPNWPGRDESVAALRAKHPDPALGRLTLSDVVGHFAGKLEAMDERPIIVGHSMGGLVVQLLLQRGLAAAGVAIDSAPPMGVFSTQWSFVKANWAHITPFADLGRPVEMSLERFGYAFVNGMSPAQQREAYETYVVPESRRVPREALTTRIDFARPHAPLLLVAGSADNIIPASLNRSNHAKYGKSGSVTDFREFEGRTHFIIGQEGWEEVADHVLAWLEVQGT